MITNLIGVVAGCSLFTIIGFFIGHKTSTDRWIEHEEYKAWKEGKKWL